MKLRNALRLSLILLMAMSLFVINMQQVQAQPIQSSTTAKYVKTAEDTLLLSGDVSLKKTVTIYNHSDSINLYVYSGNASGKITSSYIVIPPKKFAKFKGEISKIYRKAAKDSVFSQVIQGDIEFGLNIFNTGQTRLSYNQMKLTAVNWSEGNGLIRKTKFPYPVYCRI